MSQRTTPEASGAETTSYHRRQRPRLSTLALTLRTAALSGAAALLLAVGLAIQMSRGADPALGGAAATAQRQAPRVVKTTVIRRVVSLGSAVPSSAGSSAVSSSVSAAPAPVTSSAS